MYELKKNTYHTNVVYTMNIWPNEMNVENYDWEVIILKQLLDV